MSDQITSLANARVKAVVKLRERRQRDQTGLTIVEGVRELGRALDAQVVFEEVFVCPEYCTTLEAGGLMDKINSLRVPVLSTTKAVFDKLAYGDRHEGVLATARVAGQTLDQWPVCKKPLYVIIEGVEKPGNLGAILRTCDGAGVDGVMVCGGRTDVMNPHVIRSSLGAVFMLNIAVCSDAQALAFCRARGIQTCAAVPEAKALYTGKDLSGPLAIVVGNEQKGLKSFWKEHADKRVRIPMRGKSDSLNVSTATAILVYESVRQRTHE